MTGPIEQSSSPARRFRFIVCLGIVSLFADMTYEGAHSIIGPYLKDLGATALQVALIAGLGEMLGASLRFFSGRFADRSRAYWTITFSGYAMNVIAVPALALASNWQLAAIPIIAERTGKACAGRPGCASLRSHREHRPRLGLWAPLRHGPDGRGDRASAYGRGCGPVASLRPRVSVAGVPGCRHADRIGSRAPSEPRTCQTGEDAIHYGASKSLLDVRGCCWVAGVRDGGFSAARLSFPKCKHRHAGGDPFALRGRDGGERIGCAALRKASTRLGLNTLQSEFCFPSRRCHWAFLGGSAGAIAAVGCWAMSLGAQDARLRAAFASVVSMNKRGGAFGAFNGVYGVMWFAGSVVMGLLYRIRWPRWWRSVWPHRPVRR